MTTKELNNVVAKFDSLIDEINEVINKSSIKNTELAEFRLEFENGTCMKICREQPRHSGNWICYTKCIK